MATTTTIYQQFKGVFRTLFGGDDDSGRKILNLVMTVVVIMSIAIMIIEVDPDLTRLEKEYCKRLEELFIWVFLGEYLLRFWVCSDFWDDYFQAFHSYQRRLHEPSLPHSILHAVKVATSNKTQWILQPQSVVDLLAILPFFRMFRLFRVLRVFRLLKLFRYSRRLVFFVSIIKERSYELTSLLLVAVIIWGMVAISFYVVEQGVNPKLSSIWESVYWAIITITTVGYGDIIPMTPLGRGIAVIGTLTGMWVIVFMTSIIVSTLTERIISLRGFRMINQIDRMENHIIVCGLDTLGQAVCHSLEQEGLSFAGVDIDQNLVDKAENCGWVAIQGDATQEEIWQKLGVSRAHSVISTFLDEASSVFIILLALEQNPDCFIVVTGESDTSERRLKKVGAKKVVSPYLLGGSQLAHCAIRPNAQKLIDLVLKREHVDLGLEEIKVPFGSKLHGVSLADSRIRNSHNIIIVGITRQNKEMMFNPCATTKIQTGDNLICLGHKDDLAGVSDYITTT